MTLDDLSDATGISASHLSAMERGVKTINTQRLAQIATALGVETQDLLDSTAKPRSAASSTDARSSRKEAASRIVVARSNRFASIRDAARTTFIDEKRWVDIERAAVVPEPLEWEAIAQRCDTSVGYLITGIVTEDVPQRPKGLTRGETLHQSVPRGEGEFRRD